MIDSYLNTMAANIKPYEIGELHVYKAMVLEEYGDITGAINQLITNEHLILDKTGQREYLARLHIASGDAPSAEPLLTALIDMNCENREYYKLTNLARPNEDEATQLAFYDAILEKSPRSTLIPRLKLEVA